MTKSISSRSLTRSPGTSPISIETRSTGCVDLLHTQDLQDGFHILGRLSGLIYQLAETSSERRRHADDEKVRDRVIEREKTRSTG